MNKQADIKKTPLEKAPDPDLGTALIPADRYIDPEIMRREFDRLWAKTWLLAGLVSDVSKTGDYFVFEIAKESILVARGDDDKIRAFYNVCQHRGNRIKEKGCGHSKVLGCPFHRWEWNLDGSIRNIPEAQDFPQGTPAETLCLPQLRCEFWGGFVWVSMDPEIEPLLDYLGEIPDHLAPYDLENMVLVSDETVEWNCNWKTSVDIFSETYHVRGVHPEAEYLADDVNVQIDLYGPHSRFIAPMYIPSPRKIGPDKSLNDILTEYLKSEGFPADDYKGSVTDLPAAVAKFKRESSKTNGLDFSNLHDEQLTSDFHYNIFPNVTFNLFGEQAWLFLHRPHPDDPDKMYFDRMIFNRVPEGKHSADSKAGAVDLFIELGDNKVEGRPEHVSYKWGDRSSGLLLDQDASCLGGVQKGLHSRGFKGLWLSFHERRIRNFHKWWEKYMGDQDK